jgi:ComF family protein
MIFGALSNRRALPTLQLLNNWAARCWPQDCALCGSQGVELVCRECNARLPRAACASGLTACFEYRFPVRQMVMRYKYGSDLALGAWLAAELAGRVAAEPRPDLIVVPPHGRARLRERGFSPPLEIARRIARTLALSCPSQALLRLRETPAQQGLSRSARRRNVRGAFACSLEVKGARVAVVDDVVTTGATVAEIARVLRRAGARELVVWALARTPLPGGR